MKPVTKQEFFSSIGNRDVHPSIIGNYPYTSIWKTRGGQQVGKSVDSVVQGVQQTQYYLVQS